MTKKNEVIRILYQYGYSKEADMVDDASEEYCTLFYELITAPTKEIYNSAMNKISHYHHEYHNNLQQLMRQLQQKYNTVQETIDTIQEEGDLGRLEQEIDMLSD